MPKELIIRGLPQSLARDCWWLEREGDNPTCSAPSPKSPGIAVDRMRFTTLIILVLMGDLLFWGHKPGLSLALFAWCVFFAACLDHPSRRQQVVAGVVLLLGSLPMLEHVQLLSLIFLTTGLLSAVALLHIPSETQSDEVLPWLATSALCLIKSVPTAGLMAGAALIRGKLSSSGQPKTHSASTFARNWTVPLGGALLLSALLISANPVLEHILVRALKVDFDVFTLIRRAMLWIGLALLIWPLLTTPAPKAAFAAPVSYGKRPSVLNAGAVFRALVLFNVMLAIQSVMDASILIGGAALPDGMSHATYAHRGAYPLLLTALLAGAFALAARPFLDQQPGLKPLLLLWLAQNILLTLSAAFRLNLYIDAYGLTYLRVYALIWMGLVAIGLVMVAWQVYRGRPTTWLIIRTAVLGVATLYACTFINFAALIATDTLSRAANAENAPGTDWAYVCSLGHTAAKAISTQIARYPIPHIPDWAQSCVHPAATHPNWREWDFRTARVNGYLAVNSQGEAQ